ncbi:MAG: GNAT family N-acetyltransferase [Synergistaceae bacterium]|nr:GNAT family N-acetyltransferase [Synergistaceae bacterium]
MYLYGKKVILRAVEEEDTEMLRELTNSPDFERMIVGWAFPISKKDQREWFMNCHNSESRLRFTIETEQDGAVGMIGLKNIDWKNGSAEGLGIRIAKREIRSRGLGTDAQLTLMRYAFEELRLNRINASVLSYNAPSLKMCEKVGFKVEGVKRRAIYKGGKFHDLVILGCLKSDYEELIASNHYWED